MSKLTDTLEKRPKYFALAAVESLEEQLAQAEALLSEFTEIELAVVEVNGHPQLAFANQQTAEKLVQLGLQACAFIDRHKEATDA